MATPLPGRRVRGSRTGRPIMAALDLLGRRWSLRILWELRGEAFTFRELRARCDAMSPSVLNRRLGELREAGIVERGGEGYRLTPRGDDLLAALGPLSSWAKRWGRRHPAGNRSHDPYVLPGVLPVPVDNGECDHLAGMSLPPVSLPATQGGHVKLDAARGVVVFYVYPATGRPGADPPPGWDDIPGARGCTPQACAFRDHFEEVGELGATLYGVSAQAPAEQKEFAQRVGLHYALLSDERFRLARTMRLPTFEVDGRRFYQRVTFAAIGGKIVKVFYPVFPPDRNAADVVRWLRSMGRK